MSVKKSCGEFTGREFHWGLVASIAGAGIGDIISSNSAQAAQQQAEQNADQQAQQAAAQQQQLINAAAAQQRAAYQSAATAGNPMLQAAGQVKPPTPAPLPTTPNVGGTTFGGGSATSTPAGAPQRAMPVGGYLAGPQQVPQRPIPVPQTQVAPAQGQAPMQRFQGAPPVGYLAATAPAQRIAQPIMRGGAQ